MRKHRAELVSIRIYPFKSLAPIECSSAQFLASGALKGDRVFAFFRLDGSIFNAKSDSRIHQIQMSAQPDRSFEFSFENDQDRIVIKPEMDLSILENWLYERLGLRLAVKMNAQSGFPDDLDSAGPTLISTASIELISSWFELSPESIRVRLRTNLEIGGVPAFWEDGLCDRIFHIGSVRLEGTGICQRCVVPSRDPFSGKAIPHFAKHFQKRRRSDLPDSSPAAVFNHFYRVAINTKSTGNDDQIIQLGDRLLL